MLKRSTDVYIYCIYKSYIPQHHLNLCTKNNMQEMEGWHMLKSRHEILWITPQSDCLIYKPLILQEKSPTLAECSQWQLIFLFKPPTLPEKTPKCGTPCNLGNYFNVRRSHNDHQHHIGCTLFVCARQTDWHFRPLTLVNWHAHQHRLLNWDPSLYWGKGCTICIRVKGGKDMYPAPSAKEQDMHTRKNHSVSARSSGFNADGLLGGCGCPDFALDKLS